MAITMSIPRVVFVLVEMSSVCGRARAVITAARASNLSANVTGLRRLSRLGALKPLRLDILRVGACFFLLR